MRTLATPDITKAQIVAVAQAVLAVAVAFGFNISDDTRDAVLQLSTAVAVILPLADAIVRHGRATGNPGGEVGVLPDASASADVAPPVE